MHHEVRLELRGHDGSELGILHARLLKRGYRRVENAARQLRGELGAITKQEDQRLVEQGRHENGSYSAPMHLVNGCDRRRCFDNSEAPANGADVS